MAATNKSSPWTQSQIKTLRHGSKQQWGAMRIAKKLKRTPGSIRQKATSLGLSLETRATSRKAA